MTQGPTTGAYFCPPDGELSTYIDHCYNLPAIDDPMIFGLHRNAEITCSLVRFHIIRNARI